MIKIKSIGITLKNIKRRGTIHLINPDSIKLSEQSFVREALFETNANTCHPILNLKKPPKPENPYPPFLLSLNQRRRRRKRWKRF